MNKAELFFAIIVKETRNVLKLKNQSMVYEAEQHADREFKNLPESLKSKCIIIPVRLVEIN